MQNKLFSTDHLLKSLKISALNEMQKEAVEIIPKHNDILLLSATGTGKTVGFLLPLLQILKADINEIQALVLVPSRELAIQIENVFKTSRSGFKINCCYGGHSMSVEENNFSTPPDVLIGTPGRILDHLQKENFDPSTIKTLVLDEFDKSLELGFQNEMAAIYKHLTQLGKRILCSATSLEKIPEFIDNQNFKIIEYSKKSNSISFQLVVSENRDKLEDLLKLLLHIGYQSSLIFCNHRDAVDRISLFLREKGIYCETYHGGLNQGDRERSLVKFKNGSAPFLIATDLAARGLDIADVKSVIHYHVPQTQDAFIHRNGRTARMNKEGSAFLILTKDEKLPDFIEEEIIPFNLQESDVEIKKPEWVTLFIGGGKKNKINKMDVVGFLLKKGDLEKSELGLIEIKDFFSYAAVKRSKVYDLIKKVRKEKIKNRRVKIEIAR